MKNDQKPKRSPESKTEPSCLPTAQPDKEDSTLRTRQLGLTAQATLMTRRAGNAKNQGLLSMLDPIKQSNELAITEQLSSQDLVLAQKLDEVSQIYKTEMLPGEIRVWKNCFDRERPEAIAWGFRQYFKGGMYPPKPADIAQLIRQQRESPYFSGWDEDIRPKVTPEAVAEYRKRAKESRDSFFQSPEYKAFLERMKREHGI